MGYSGTTKQQDADPDGARYGEWIINDTNDTFMVFIGEDGENRDDVLCRYHKYKDSLVAK